MRTRISELREYRRNGIRTFVDAEVRRERGEILSKQHSPKLDLPTMDPPFGCTIPAWPLASWGMSCWEGSVSEGREGSGIAA